MPANPRNAADSDNWEIDELFTQVLSTHQQETVLTKTLGLLVVPLLVTPISQKTGCFCKYEEHKLGSEQME